jgi:hypothetical protein
MKEPRPETRRAAARKSVQPGTSPEPAPARAVLEDISSRCPATYLPMSGSVRRGGRIHRVTDDSVLPDALTLDEAYRAAFFMTDLYVGLESDPDEGLVLFRQYLQSDPARTSKP